MRAALEYLCTPQGSSQNNAEVAGSYKPPGVASWSIGKIVSGKYVMIVDVIVDEQEGLDTVTMVSISTRRVRHLMSRMQSDSGISANG